MILPVWLTFSSMKLDIAAGLKWQTQRGNDKKKKVFIDFQCFQFKKHHAHIWSYSTINSQSEYYVQTQTPLSLVTADLAVITCRCHQKQTLHRAHFSKYIFPCFFSPGIVSLLISMHPQMQGKDISERKGDVIKRLVMHPQRETDRGKQETPGRGGKSGDTRKH